MQRLDLNPSPLFVYFRLFSRVKKFQLTAFDYKSFLTLVILGNLVFLLWTPHFIWIIKKIYFSSLILWGLSSTMTSNSLPKMFLFLFIFLVFSINDRYSLIRPINDQSYPFSILRWDSNSWQSTDYWSVLAIRYLWNDKRQVILKKSTSQLKDIHNRQDKLDHSNRSRIR